LYGDVKTVSHKSFRQSCRSLAERPSDQLAVSHELVHIQGPVEPQIFPPELSKSPAGAAFCASRSSSMAPVDQHMLATRLQLPVDVFQHITVLDADGETTSFPAVLRDPFHGWLLLLEHVVDQEPDAQQTALAGLNAATENLFSSSCRRIGRIHAPTSAMPINA
jgi:hypothetical protein